MNEIMEILYHWHHGSSIKGIAKSLGYDRKTIRRYVRCGQEAGVRRGEPLPDEQDRQGKFKEVLERSGPCLYLSADHFCAVP